MADRKTPFIDGHFLFYPLDSLEDLFETVKTNSKKAFFEKLAEMEQPGKEGLSVKTLKKMVFIGLNYDPSDKVSPEQASKLTNQYYSDSENDYDALESLIYDAFADSGLVDKKAREEGKEYIAKRKQLITEQKFIELQELERNLSERKKKLEEEADKGEATSTVSPYGNG